MTRELEPNGIDKEAFQVEDETVQNYKDFYWNMANAYCFLKRVFFAGEDGARAEHTFKITGKKGKYSLDVEDIFDDILPTILMETATRLTDMGEIDYVNGINEMVRERWVEKT